MLGALSLEMSLGCQECLSYTKSLELVSVSLKCLKEKLEPWNKTGFKWRISPSVCFASVGVYEI